MPKIQYDAQVQVHGLHFDSEANLWRGYPRWEGIDLAEAIRRVRALPLREQAGVSIFAPGGVLGIEAIHEIYERPDFPGL